MNESIWEVLDCEPTQDRRLVKKAYSRKLKELGNEASPEQFQMLKEAFDLASDYCKSSKTKNNHLFNYDEIAEEPIILQNDLTSIISESEKKIDEFCNEINRLESSILEGHLLESDWDHLFQLVETFNVTDFRLAQEVSVNFLTRSYHLLNADIMVGFRKTLALDELAKEMKKGFENYNEILDNLDRFIVYPTFIFNVEIEDVGARDEYYQVRFNLWQELYFKTSESDEKIRSFIAYLMKFEVRDSDFNLLLWLVEFESELPAYYERNKSFPDLKRWLSSQTEKEKLNQTERLLSDFTLQEYLKLSSVTYLDKVVSEGETILPERFLSFVQGIHYYSNEVYYKSVESWRTIDNTAYVAVIMHLVKVKEGEYPEFFCEEIGLKRKRKVTKTPDLHDENKAKKESVGRLTLALLVFFIIAVVVGLLSGRATSVKDSDSKTTEIPGMPKMYRNLEKDKKYKESLKKIKEMQRNKVDDILNKIKEKELEGTDAREID